MPDTTSIVFRNLLNADPELEELLRLGLSDGTLKLINMAAEYGFEFVAWISQEEARKREQPDRVARRPVNVQYRRRRRRSRSEEAENGYDASHENGNGAETNGNGERTNGHRRRRNGGTRSVHGEGRRRRRSSRDRHTEARDPGEDSHRNGDHEDQDSQRGSHADSVEDHYSDSVDGANGESKAAQDQFEDTNGNAGEPFGGAAGNGSTAHVVDADMAGSGDAVTPDRARPRRSRRSVRRKSPTGTATAPLIEKGHEAPTDESVPAKPANSLPTKLW